MASMSAAKVTPSKNLKGKNGKDGAKVNGKKGKKSAQTGNTPAKKAVARKTKVPQATELVVKLGDKEMDVSLNEDDSFFQSKINLVPAMIYVPQEESEEQLNAKYMKNRKGKAPKQGIKDTTKKAEKRRTKYSEGIPLAVDTVVEQMNERREEEGRNPTEGATPLHPLLQRTTTPAKNYEELKERLATKRAEFHTKRQRNPRPWEDATEESAQKKTKQSRLDEARDKKRERKRARRDEIKKIREATDTAISGAKGDVEMTDATAETRGNAGTSSERLSPDDTERMLRDKVTESILNPKIAFGPLAGIEQDNSEDGDKDGVPKRGKNNILNVKKLLRQAEENKAVIEELKNSALPEERQLAQDKSWDVIERKALGERVPEPKHLKKQIKRIERKKQKSTEQWDARLKAQKDDKSERISKRQANIDKAQKDRVAAKLKKKGIVLEDPEKVKTRRQRPGFEGQHSGFINDKDDDGKGNKGGKDVSKSSKSGKTPKSSKRK
mmetsp:Transcript_3955/g.6947  ORF Transcript_3955/g.6947 Transcript_3955/m.6947 type:complete len:497 (-) Transcript_3955:116-1606(-)